MKCPYCSKELVEGILSGDRYANTWKPKDKEAKPEYIYLKRGSIFKFNSIKDDAYVCPGQ